MGLIKHLFPSICMNNTMKPFVDNRAVSQSLPFEKSNWEIVVQSLLAFFLLSEHSWSQLPSNRHKEKIIMAQAAFLLLFLVAMEPFASAKVFKKVNIDPVGWTPEWTSSNIKYPF